MKIMLKLTASLFVVCHSSAFAAAPYPQYEALVEKHSAAQRLDKNLVWAVMGRESSGNRYALSNKDARGLLQVIPGTAARMGVNPKNLYDPEQNIIAGTRYLRFLCNHFPDRSSIHGCNLDLVLAGYNAGEGAVRRYGGIPPYRETKLYVRNVKARYARLSGKNPAAIQPVPVTVANKKTSDSPYRQAVFSERTNFSDIPVRIERGIHQQVVLQKPEPKSWDVFGDF